jgi:lysophospholipase L1-like esterase
MDSTYPSRSGRTRVRIAIGVVVALALVAAGVVVLATRDRGRDGPAPTVLVVGDSLLYQSAPTVSKALESRGWHAVIDGRPGSGITGGFSIGSWPDRITDLVKIAKPKVAIVELGTNGCTDCTKYDDGIDRVMQRLRGVPQVYWVNVKLDCPVPPDPGAVNAAINRATKRWKKLRVIDMNSRFYGKPQLLIADRIHFNDAGEKVFAKLLASSLPKG